MTVQNIMTTECSSSATKTEPTTQSLVVITGTSAITIYSVSVGTATIVEKSSSTATLTYQRTDPTTLTTLTTLTKSVLSSEGTVLTETTAPTAIASATPTPAPAKPQLSRTQIGVVTASSVLGLLFLIGLAFLIRRCVRKRKEDNHSKISYFWRGMFSPTVQDNGALPLSSLPREATASAGFAHPSATTDPICQSAATNLSQPSQTGKSKLSSFIAALAAKTHIRHSDKFPLFHNSRAERLRQAARAQAQADRKAAEIEADPNFDAQFGWGHGKGSSDLIEVCLDEDVALEELDKEEERRHTQDAMVLDAARKKLSPFPAMSPVSPATS